MENGDLCPICENNIVLENICNDCNLVFCSDCLREKTIEELVCSQCGSNEISNDNDNDFICAKCKSENIVSMQKIEYYCPSCSSKNIIKVSEKKEIIQNRFNDIIRNTREFINPLEDRIALINKLQENLIRLREDSVKVLHFSNLEMELIQVIKLFDNIKKAVQKKTSEFYDEINRNLEYFFGLESLSAKMLPVVIAIAENLESQSEENVDFITQSLERLNPRFKPIELKVDFMNKIQSLFKSYSSLISLEENEIPMFGLKCKLDSGEEGDNEYSSKSGVILLTERRLYFLHEKGVFKKKTTLLFSLLLDDLNSVREEGSINKKLSLEFATGMYKFKINKEKRGQLVDFIAKAREFDISKFNSENSLGLKSIQCTIEEFKYSLEDAIFTLIGYQSKKIRESVMDKYKEKKKSIPDALSNEIPSQNPMKYYNKVNPLISQSSRERYPNLDSKNSELGQFPNLNRYFGATNNNINQPLHQNDINQTEYCNANVQYCDNCNQYHEIPSIEVQRSREIARPSQYQYQVPAPRPRPVPEQMYTSRSPREVYYQERPGYRNMECNNLDYLYETYNRRPMPVYEYREEVNNYPYEPAYYYEPRIDNRIRRNEYNENLRENQRNRVIRNIGDDVFNQNIRRTSSIDNKTQYVPKTNINYTNDYEEEYEENYDNNPYNYDSNFIGYNNNPNNNQSNNSCYIPNSNRVNNQNIDRSQNINNQSNRTNYSQNYNQKDAKQSQLYNTLNKARYGNSVVPYKISNDSNLNQLENADEEILNSLKMEKSIKNSLMGKEIRRSNDTDLIRRSKNRNNGNSSGTSIIRGIKSIFNEKDDEQYKINTPHIADEIKNEPRIDTSKLYHEDRKKERLIGLQREEQSLLRTLEMISIKLKRGLISEENYIDHYQKLQSTLFNVQKQIKQLIK